MSLVIFQALSDFEKSFGGTLPSLGIEVDNRNGRRKTCEITKKKI